MSPKFEKYLAYDPKTGWVTWLVQIAKHVKIGDRAGSFSSSSGYRNIGLFSKNYREHRVIWVLQTSKWPTADLDHIDGNRANNKWNNLRSATRSQNLANSKIRGINTSGYKGVSWDSREKKYHARIKKNGRTISLGYFIDPKEAHITYIKAAEKHFREYSRAA